MRKSPLFAGFFMPALFESRAPYPGLREKITGYAALIVVPSRREVEFSQAQSELFDERLSVPGFAGAPDLGIQLFQTLVHDVDLGRVPE